MLRSPVFKEPAKAGVPSELVHPNKVMAAHDLLEQQNKRLSILYELSLTVGKSLDLETTLDEVLLRIIAFMGVDAGVIFVIDDETLEMIPVVQRNLSEEVMRDLCENKVKIGECMCGTIAQYDTEVIIYEKASADPRFTRGVLKHEVMEFYAGLPLKAKGKVVGVLCVITSTRYSPDEGLLDILRAATQPIGLAIENARHFSGTKTAAEARKRYENFNGIITNSAKMLSILDLVKKIKDVPANILIYGESGTGKELVARAIHYNSIRKEKPFVAINCSALPESLLEAELFGYVRGAFSGASADKTGLFETADGGSVFLDETDAMSRSLQAKLLRVLQDGTFFRVGSTEAVAVDVRIIAATNQRLEEVVKSGRFREDLYYRLNVIRLEIPSLRERTEDVPLLARYFTNRFSRKIGKKVRRIRDDALEALMQYQWPGNVRELENTIERAVVIAEKDEIRPEDLPSWIPGCCDIEGDWNLKAAREKAEIEHLLRVLNMVGGSKKKAAEILGLETSTLWKKLKRFKVPGL